MENKRGGPRKPGGFGGKPAGARGPRREGGSYDRKPREGGYERKPRAEGERSYRPRAEGSSYGEKRPYQRREGGATGGYERKPREFGDRPARAPRAEGERSYRPRAEGSSYGEKRPYQRREGGSFDRKPREGGYERKPREFGDRPARAPRAEGERSYRPRTEGGYDRKPREFGDRPARAPRAEGERSYRPRREEGEGGNFERPQRGEGKNARFDGKREIKRDRTPRTEEKQFQQDGWLVGTHAVVAALSAGRRKVRQIWLLAEPKGELQTLIAQHPEWPVDIKAKPDFEREFGDAVHQGVAVLVGNLPQPSLPEFLSLKPQLVVALDQVTDPHNLGAIVRSCAAFGAAGVMVTEHRAAGLSPAAAKAAAGAMETVPVVEVVNLVQSIEMMKEAGFTVIGLAGEAEDDVRAVKASGPLCLVVGSEGDGLRRLTREHCDKLVKIAISSNIESLNVSVATGVALALLSKQ